MNSNIWEKRLAIFDQIVAEANFERKGKTMPYTSDNGHMFSLLNKDGEIGIRLSREAGEKFMDEHQSTRFKSHGSFMRGYVLIPDTMLKDTAKVAAYLKQGHAFVMSLDPK